MWVMENVNEQKSEQTQTPQTVRSEPNNTNAGEKRKISRTWEAAMRYKGSVIVLDPTLYER